LNKVKRDWPIDTIEPVIEIETLALGLQKKNYKQLSMFGLYARDEVATCKIRQY
jgi:hypothetical protein